MKYADGIYFMIFSTSLLKILHQTTAEYNKNYKKNLSGNSDEFCSEKQTTSALDTTTFKARNFTNVNTLAWKCQERGLTDDEESQN